MRELFEIPEGISYLNCANMAPQLRTVTEAGLQAVRAKETPWKLGAADWFSGTERLRDLAARVAGCSAECMALVPAASYGIAVAAANLPVERGQSIVVLDQEFPSNFYAWRTLAQRREGRIKIVRREAGEKWTDALLRSIDRQTAIVSVPQCHWTDGSTIDLTAVGEACRAAKAALVIDASQSLGAGRLDIDAVQPDFLVAVGYKWLLGPYGLGYLYAAPKWHEAGVPLEQSWLTRAGSENFARLVEYTDEYRPGARRFDVGETAQFVLVAMAAAALEQILAWGVERIERSIGGLTDYVAECAGREGHAVPGKDERAAHMIGIRMKSGAPDGLAQRLAAEKVFVSVRGDAIRVAPHLYNDREDIDRLFAALNMHGR